MFILSKLEDTIAIKPADFEKRTRQAIEDNINEKYSNKVLPQIGLCICLYDVLSSSSGLIDNRSTSDSTSGSIHLNLIFRLLVFRPFKGEILEGRVRSSTPGGIRLSLAFFDDIVVPPSHLFPDTEYRADEAVFIWTNEGQPYYFDENERVRFRVEEEIWQDQTPGDGEGKPGTKEPAGDADVAANMGVAEMDEVKNRRCPWRIVASMQQGGLGVLEWW